MHKNTWFLRFAEGTDGNQANAGDTAPEAGKADADQATQGNPSNSSASDSDSQKTAEKIVEDYVKRATAGQAARFKEDNASEPASEDEVKAEEEPAVTREQFEQLQKQLEELTAAKQEQDKKEHEALAASVAKAANLPDGFHARLRGETREELEADAKEIARLIGARAFDPSQGRGGTRSAAESLQSAIQSKLAQAGIN